MSKEYLIGLGIDGNNLFKNLKETIGVLEQVEAKSGEVGKTIDEAFDKGVQASNEFDKKMQNTSKNLEAVREMGKLAGKEMAEALSGKNINTSEFEKKLSSFKDKLSSITANVDIELDDQKIRIFQQQIDGAKNEVEQLNVALNIAKEVLAGLDANSDEFKQLSEAITFTESALNEFETEVVQTTEKSKSLKAELRTIQQEMARLEMAGETGSQQFRDLSLRAGELRDQIGDTSAQIAILASDTKHFDAMISGVTGLVGAFTAVQGATALFGAENEELNEALLKVNGAMAVLQGLQAVSETLNKDSAFSVIFLRNARVADTVATEAQTGATILQTVAMNGATLATKALRIGLASIGIGLIIALIAYLIANWDKLKASMEKLLPATKDAGKAWDELKAIFVGVGTALVEYIIAPFKIAIALITEGLDGAVEQAKESYNVIDNYNKGHAQQTKQNAINHAIEMKKISLENWDNQIKIADAEGKDTYKTRERWYQNKIALAKKEGEDTKELTQELLEFQAKKRGEDRKKAEEDAKKRADDAKRDAEKRKKEAEEAHKKALELQKKQNEQIAKFANELKNIEIENIDEKTKRERSALEKQWDDRIKAITDEKALTKQAEEDKIKILEGLNKAKQAKLKEFDETVLRERRKIELEANAEIQNLAKDSQDKELELLKINNQKQLDAINEKYKNEEALRLKLVEATEKNTAEKEKEIKEKYQNQSLKNDEEKALLSIELSSTYAKKSEETERQKQIALLRVKLEYAQKALDLLISQGKDENSVEVMNAKKNVKEAQDAVNEAVKANDNKDFDFMDFLGIGEGLDPEDRQKLKKAVNESMKVLSEFTQFMIDNIQEQMDAKAEQVEQTQSEIDDLEDKLDDEKELRENGLANNVEVIEAEIAEKKRQKEEQIKQEEELLEKKKQYQKMQLALDTVQQLSGLITASVNIFEGFSTIPIVGIPLAIAMIGLMFGTFVATKAKAAQAINQQTVQHGEGGEISGRTHGQGGEKYYNADGSKVKELEDGEFVVKRLQYGKFGKLVRAINDDDFSGLSINDYAIAEMFRQMGFDFDAGVGEARNLQVALMSLGYSSKESHHLAKISEGIAQLVESDRNTPKSWIKNGYNHVKEGNKVTKEKLNPVKIEDDVDSK